MGTDESSVRFEKSLYDLIRGLRNHKGNEREYIQDSLRECRNEIKGSDMDLKATALLKLIYLEMFGHDMSWASFHVLEVMSSSKYLQKRVGYLGAVQSFRPDTEVLMLATNLLKKDITSPLPTTITLPLVTLPHINNSSLALSLLSDLLPRLSHSNPSIRKKTVVTLYRLALVYPETLRPAWPKIKDLLMDEEEDSSVTAAIINVVCELGWRRPRDFLPLAPRLFELLVDGGNNWMAIKIIKLFATLTPFEPRLVKKLLPPLTNLIRTTPAMSLLYECINGIIQGGILEGTEGAREGDEIATLCVGKLRGMIVVEGDPNLKYVALLAFNRIVSSHPYLVSAHQDVIMSCIDDADISIRMQALDLGAGMVNGDNIVTVVECLMKQLRNAPLSVSTVGGERDHVHGVEPAADPDGEDPEETLRLSKGTQNEASPLPTEYRITIIGRILDMCSRDTYANISDFEWYVETLVQLVRLLPVGNMRALGSSEHGEHGVQSSQVSAEGDISCAIGWELRNVAVRVSSVRPETVLAASSLLVVQGSEGSTVSTPIGAEGVLRFAAWIVGEYAASLPNAHNTLNSLIHSKAQLLPPLVISSYLQSIPKVFISIISGGGLFWSSERKTMSSLLLARIVHFLEPLTTHPSLEVQERSVELLELMRVASQAIAGYGVENEHGPLLLTKAIPALFSGSELNPVAPNAQEKVPQPDSLDLDIPINPNLLGLLHADEKFPMDSESAGFEPFYNHRPSRKAGPIAAFDALPPTETDMVSYQQTETSTDNPNVLARKRFERQGRNRDDPFYIASDDPSSGTSTPFHDIIRNTNGEDVDVDSIPIMSLDLGDRRSRAEYLEAGILKHKRKHPKKYQIAMDENIDLEEPTDDRIFSSGGRVTDTNSLLTKKRDKSQRALLEVDSSGLGGFSLEGDESATGQLGVERQEVDDAEMKKALEEVEHLRLEMQRASERVRAADGVPPEGTLVKKKSKKRKPDGVPKGTAVRGTQGTTADGNAVDSSEVASVVQITKTKKKKKRSINPRHDDSAGEGNGKEVTNRDVGYP